MTELGPQQTDPWHAVAPTLAYAPPSPTDLLSAPVPVPRRRRRTWLLLGIGLAVALVAGTLAYVGVAVWYGWSTTEPEAVLPGSSAAFARIDLSPGLGQQLRLNSLAKKFPKQGSSTEDAVAQLERELVQALGLDPLTYDADIKSWFADRLGEATWTATGQAAGVCTLTALASRDDAAARTALTKVERVHGSTFGFAFNHGYAVTARCAGVDAQAAATAAVAEAQAASLAVLPAFTAAVHTLPSGQVALGWADLAEAGRLVGEAFGFDSHALQVGGVPLVPQSAGPSGHVIVGIQAVADGIETRFRLDGTGAGAGPGTDVMADLGALPGGTVVGVAADLRGFTRGLIADPNPSLGALSTITGQLEAFYGSTLSISASQVAPGAELRLVSRAADASHATAIANLLNTPGARFGLPNSAGVTRNASTVTLSTRGYQPGTGTLADAALFRSAMAGRSGTSLVAAYVDIAKLAPSLNLSVDGAAQLKPVKAVGLTTGYSGTALVGLLRVVIA